ncbi:MAG TPA: hypothetical protein VH134_03655 [Candidatus Dormibacteraeota bacterium]|jgi:hypothetical protein|nr:hypothetical protein [Candidatus Dormibacteraeota bacterium]
MSRRLLSADEPGCTWEYGWDPEQQTYYARLVSGEDPGGCELARFGTRAVVIDSTDALMYLMGVRLPGECVSVLEHDRLTDSREEEAPPRHRHGARAGAMAATESPFALRTLIAR